ncbi:winged helix-turn-helix transcriptional regulator [Ottowia caeni]|uniref:winged helix-turn-helix transcriptional regulator n=1 Tax=Ottowia caeni TaxID=2870339 RepID=UPI001E3BD495|nr:helix-turn-helix transcriptional regulator [Ottowia caeni]
MSSHLPTFDLGTASAIMAAGRQVADVLCDRWTLLILLSAHAGDTCFSDFRDRWGISNRMLSSRLKALESQGLMVKMVYSRRPIRHSYHLTPKGTALFDVLICMINWEASADGGKSDQLVRIEHLGCSHGAIHPSIHCSACNEPVTASNVDFTINNSAQQELPQWGTAYRRSEPRSSTGPSTHPHPLEIVLSIYGNKWSNEIVRCAFLRVSTFGEIQRHTGISTNILADRLTRLVDAGIFRQESSKSDGRSSNYKLTARGRGLFSIILAMWAWADRWIEERIHAPLRLTHQDCGKTFHVISRCNQCSDILKPSNSRIVLSSLDEAH